jgi:hypothetical protein
MKDKYDFFSTKTQIKRQKNLHIKNKILSFAA